MPRGRQRNAQRKPGTVLPSGRVQPANWAADAGRANTGKGGGSSAAFSAGPRGPALAPVNKNTLYRHALPLPFDLPEEEERWRQKELKEAEKRARLRANRAHAAAAREAEAAAAAASSSATGTAGSSKVPASASAQIKGKARQIEDDAVGSSPRQDQRASWSAWLSSLVPSFLTSSVSSSAASSTTPSRTGPLRVVGHFDPLTCSVWVVDPEGAAVLWRRGFFGKGSLSRSEPTWRERQLHTATILARRARDEKRAADAAAAADTANAKPAPPAQPLLTAEELTAVRRRERQAAKIERAKAAVRAGTQLPDGVTALGGELDEAELAEIRRKAKARIDGAGGSNEPLPQEEGDEDEDDGYRGEHVPALIYFRQPDGKTSTDGAKPTPTAQPAGPVDASASQPEPAAAAAGSTTAASAGTPAMPPAAAPAAAIQDDDEPIDVQVEEVEHVQLTMVEAFFLAAMLGVLQVKDQQGNDLDLDTLYTLCLAAHPHFPFIAAPLLRDLPLRSPSSFSSAQLAALQRPDNPFLLSYVAYHYFRSLGWVVKGGAKFCVDFLLYKRGPVFGHAEFAVLVLPAYAEEDGANDDANARNSDDPAGDADSDDDDDDEAARGRELFGPREAPSRGGTMDWVRFSSVNRVNTQVLKTLILCYVALPSVRRCAAERLTASPQALIDGIKSGKSFSVKTVAVRRWVPARMKP